MSRVLRNLLALALSGAMLVVPASAVSADLEDELAEVLGQIEDIEEQLTDAAAERSGIVGEILETRDRLQLAQARLGKAEDALRSVRLSLTGTEVELASTKEQLAQSYQSIAETRRRIEDNRGAAQDWIKQQYMRRSEGDMVAAAVSTEHVSDLGRMVHILEVVADRSTASIDRHEALGVEEERQQARIETREQTLLGLRATLAAEELRQAELTEMRRICRLR